MTYQPRKSFESPRFAQPATFMRLPHVEDARGLDVAIVGVPFDGGTSYRPGARLAPREIRSQSSLIRPYNYFQKVAPFDRLNVADVGDVDAAPVSIEKCYGQVADRIGAFWLVACAFGPFIGWLITLFGVTESSWRWQYLARGRSLPRFLWFLTRAGERP